MLMPVASNDSSTLPPTSNPLFSEVLTASPGWRSHSAYPTSTRPPTLCNFTALHEIGHVLGFGTLWERFGHLQDPSAGAVRPPDTHFSGELAIAAFNRSGGASYRAAKVPVENNPARYRGAEDLHWRESVFGDELMTGAVRGVRGTFEPLSSVTVASVTTSATPSTTLPRTPSACRVPAPRCVSRCNAAPSTSPATPSRSHRQWWTCPRIPALLSGLDRHRELLVFFRGEARYL